MAQASLLHLQLEQARLWTTSRGGIVTLAFIEGVAAFIQAVDRVLTLVFFVIVFLQAVCMLLVYGEPHLPGCRTLDGTLKYDSSVIETRSDIFTYGSSMTRRICFQIVFHLTLTRQRSDQADVVGSSPLLLQRAWHRLGGRHVGQEAAESVNGLARAARSSG